MHSEQCTRSASGRDGNAGAAHTKRHLEKEQGSDIKAEMDESSATRERQQDLQALQNCVKDIRNGSQCIGNEKQGLEILVKDTERAVDLVEREMSLLDRGLQSLSEESEMFLKPGGVVDDDVQHLLE
ncbi:hypothetical protein VKT23_000355 [Stygiomarasmius scandens]|uniref:Uncharacterized protein n=1 Tax=Marasmiellus scandens TaxID=2682957 RepID=A0ABR1K6I6_9AGAR